MDSINIDYSEINFGTPIGEVTEWEEPVHKYFGPKDPRTGRRMPEPKYAYVAFPAMMYRLKDGKMTARIVTSQAESDALSNIGFADSPAAFGVITNPSQEEMLSAQDAADLAEIEAATAAADSIPLSKDEVAIATTLPKEKK